MRQSDIIDRLKKKHPDMTEEAIKLTIRSFHDGFRYYLSHPEECKGGILINGLLALTISPKKIEKFIKKLKYENLELRSSEFSKKHTTREEVIEYYENLLKTVTKHERQKGTKRQYDGFAG